MTSAAHFSSLVLMKATPLLLAALGGLLSESCGVINFALEGMMLCGAFGAVWTTYATGSPWIGLMGGTAAGVFIGLLHGMVSLNFRANQIVSSIAMNLLAAGLSGMLLNQVFGVYGTSPTVSRLPHLGSLLPRSLEGSALIAGFLADISPVTLLALLLGAFFMFFFSSTTWGLHLRACGEEPEAAAAAGLPVYRLRLLSVLGAGSLAGLAGAYLSISELSQFVENITHGRGYLAIAAVILGRWHAPAVFLAALFFGASEALSEWLAVSWPRFPSQFFLALPYLLCLGVLTFRPGRRRPPSALGKH